MGAEAGSSSEPVIEFICHARDNGVATALFLHAVQLQSARNWRLTFLSDRYDEAVVAALRPVIDYDPRVGLLLGDERAQDHGWRLRHWYLPHSVGTHLLLTSTDCFYPPDLVRSVTAAIRTSDPDVILLDHVTRLPDGGESQRRSVARPGRYETDGRDLAATLFRRADIIGTDLAQPGPAGDAQLFDRLLEQRGAMRTCIIHELLMVRCRDGPGSPDR